MNLFHVSFLNIVLIATLTRSVLSGCISTLSKFSVKLESQPRHNYPYAGIYRDPKNSSGFAVMAKQQAYHSSKSVFTFDSTNTVVTYLSKTTMKTMSMVQLAENSKKEFLLCGLLFKGSNEALKFFNDYLKRDASYQMTFQGEFPFSKLFIDEPGPSNWLGNGGKIHRGEVERTAFTYAIKSDQEKVLAIFSTGNYKVETADDDRRLKIIARATVGSYEETKAYVLTFQWTSEKDSFHRILQADDAYLRNDSPDFQKLGAPAYSASPASASSSYAASCSSSRNAAGNDDDDDADDDATLTGIQMTKLSSGGR